MCLSGELRSPRVRNSRTEGFTALGIRTLGGFRAEPRLGFFGHPHTLAVCGSRFEVYGFHALLEEGLISACLLVEVRGLRGVI